MKITRQVQNTAYHEAGHAVASIKVNIPFRWVSIQPDGVSLGQLQSDTRSAERLITAFAMANAISPSMYVRAFNYAVVCMAGPLAEKRYRGRFDHIGASRDYEWAGILLGGISWSSSEMKHQSRLAIVRAGVIVDGSWSEVEAVAQALLEKEKLVFKEVSDIISACPKPLFAPRADLSGL